MKAFVRRDLIQAGEYPPASIKITPRDWEKLEFNCWLIEGYNDDFEESYNLIMVHPLTCELFWGYSIDFDFKN